MELMIYTTMDGLPSRLETTYPDLSVIAPSRIDQARRLLAGDRPPDALYVDDSRGTPIPDLWGLIQAAHQAQVTVLVNMYGMGQSLLNEARLLGLATVTERDTAAVTAWIGQAMGVTARASGGRVPILAVGAAKGGIGKTFVTCLLAEGLRRRGFKVLVWDSDISNLLESIVNSWPGTPHVITIEDNTNYR